MNLEQLKILEAIVETGSYRAAAHKLNNSQPTLSRSIKRLEDELGIKLFNRDSYRPVLTKEGEVFFKAANITLKAAGDLRVLGQELGLNNAETEIRISLDPLVPPSLLARIVEIGTSQNFSPKFFIKTAVLSEASSDVQQGISGLAIGPNVKFLKDVECKQIFDIELKTIASKAAFKKYKMDEELLLSGIPQILISQGSFAETPDKFRFSRHVSPKEVYVSDHHLKVDIIKRGLGWGKIARHELENFPRNGWIELKTVTRPRLTVPFYIMRNEKKPLGPICRKIFHQLINQFTHRA